MGKYTCKNIEGRTKSMVQIPNFETQGPDDNEMTRIAPQNKSKVIEFYFYFYFYGAWEPSQND